MSSRREFAFQRTTYETVDKSSSKTHVAQFLAQTGKVREKRAA